MKGIGKKVGSLVESSNCQVRDDQDLDITQYDKSVLKWAKNSQKS